MRKRIDGRDNITSRVIYKEGSPRYVDYYGRNPERKEKDAYLKSLPGISHPASRYFHPLHSPMVNIGFEFLDDIKKFADGPVNPHCTPTDPVEMSRKLKNLAHWVGAVEVGICEMEPRFYYTHEGHREVTYWQELPEGSMHKYGIAFAVEMDHELINRAPLAEETVACVKGYIDAAIVGMWLSYYIRGLGYPAHNHMDGNYKVMVSLVAQEAGVGQIGRNSLLTTRKYGSRVRTGVVTTDMELIPDGPKPFGLPEFCEECGICARFCPGQTIPRGKREMINGDLRWKIDSDKCYEIWQKGGTDCGICIASCPFSQGVDPRLIDAMQDDPAVRRQILEEHYAKHGPRAFTKDIPGWMK